MLDLKDLQFLTALARQQHFARAAEECGVSQPAFSMRIAKLEEHLQTKIVRRGNRFQGLTPDGESIVRHALQIMEDVKRLETEFSAEPGDLTGVLSLAVIPTAAALAARTTIQLREANPGITVHVKTMSSLAILHGLEAGSYDAGITYTESATSESVAHPFLTVTPIYDEEYVLLAPVDMVDEQREDITWKDAGALPLCVLEPGMQNRNIVDRVFQQVGIRPKIVAELSSLTPGVIMAIQGAAATIVPKVLVENTGAPRSVRVLPLVEPEVQKSLSLVTAERGAPLRTVQALKELLQ